MITKEQVEAWVNNLSKNTCKGCNDNCCNCEKHAISFSAKNMGPFVEAGIPVISIDELSPSAQYLFLEHRTKTGKKIHTIQEKPVPMPSLVQCAVEGMDSGEDRYEIYANRFCPLYKDGKCTIHRDSRRPDICKSYPILSNPQKGIATFLSSCREFNREDLYTSFRQSFPEFQLVDPILFMLRETRELQLKRRA